MIPGKKKVHIRKWNGDDSLSWAVFVEGQTVPAISGLSMTEARYHKKVIETTVNWKAPART